jgi:hypothetical protein
VLATVARIASAGLQKRLLKFARSEALRRMSEQGGREGSSCSTA